MLIHEITLRGILSFGPDTPPLSMQPLNVLIGPNGSGKSNLIAAIDFMRSSPNQLSKPIRDGGGTRAWVWKGGHIVRAVVELLLDGDTAKAMIFRNSTDNLRHRIEFYCSLDSQFLLGDEIVAELNADTTKSAS